MQATQGRDGEISVAVLASAALRQRTLLVIGPIIGLTFGVLSSVLWRDYTAESRFRPESSLGDASRLAGIASQFGLSLPNVEDPGSLEFYEELARSRDLLREVVQSTLRFVVRPESNDSIGGTVLELYGVSGDTPDERVQRAVDLLRGNVLATSHSRAGLVEVRTSGAWPGLAEAVNRRLLDLINRFNLESRQSRAGAERRFVEARMEEARRELQDAEGALERFLERNRRYTQSPQLTFEAARLQRRVDLRQQVFVSLAQAYEQARIDEVRNTPVITVVDGPEGSARASRGVVVSGLVGLVLAFLVSLALAFAREHLSALRAQSPAEYEHLAALWQHAVQAWLPRRFTRRPRATQQL